VKPRTKKVLMIVGLGLLAFYIITDPQEAATNVGGLLDWLKGAAEAIITFVKSVFQ
jgi:hypothetical protein